MRHKRDTRETQARHKRDKRETQVRHKRDSRETQERLKKDTRETQERPKRDQKRPTYIHGWSYASYQYLVLVKILAGAELGQT